MRFSLRYRHHDLELNEGQFVVGRSSGCQLLLDDPLVSRRHALFVVAKGGVTVEDQRSRNGILVNGLRIAARTSLKPGDRILIGSQELVLNADEGSAPDPSFRFAGTKTLSRVATHPEPPPDADRVTPPPSVVITGGDPDAEASMVRRIDAFKLIGGVAEKALALGRADEAERLLAGPLTELVEATRNGNRLPSLIVDAVSRLAAKLSAATGNGLWADYVVELYQAQGRPCPAAVIDELNSALRRVTAIDLGRLRAYVAALREKQGTFGPAERFLVQRIEGLERMAALR
jgi:pSer/pThr/pTyr-binding forkhead associated (FHA) protein